MFEMFNCVPTFCPPRSLFPSGERENHQPLRSVRPVKSVPHQTGETQESSVGEIWKKQKKCNERNHLDLGSAPEHGNVPSYFS